MTIAKERKLQVRKANVFQQRVNVVAGVGVSYVNSWLDFNLLLIVIFVKNH